MEIPKLAEEYGASHCFAQREDAWEESNEERKLGEKCELILTEGKGLFENEDLPFELKDLPGVFSSFRRKVEKNLKIRPLIPAPEKISCSWTPKNQLPTFQNFGLDEFETDERAALYFRGGEDAGISWMKEWIWERDCLKYTRRHATEWSVPIIHPSYPHGWLPVVCPRSRFIGRLRNMRRNGWPMKVPTGYFLNFYGVNSSVLLAA